MNIILKAARFAASKHFDQAREDGEHYINHPMRVAGHLSYATSLDENCIAAAWLHDVMEDCGVSYKELRDEFNTKIATLVLELTNQFTKEKYPTLNRNERKFEDFKRLRIVSKEAKIIKLFDRYDNTIRSSVVKEHYVRETRILLEDLGPVDVVYNEIENWCNEYDQIYNG